MFKSTSGKAMERGFPAYDLGAVKGPGRPDLV